MTAFAPVAKRTRSQLSYKEVLSQQKTIENQHNPFQIDETKGVECEKEEAKVLAMLMSQISNDIKSKRLSLMQQCNFNEGMKMFGDKGKEAALKELRQQHARKCFAPMAVAASLDQECRRAQNALVHSAEKRD